MAKKKQKSKKNPWFSSTVIVLVSVLVIFSAIGYYKYGWEVVLDEYIKYIIGASFTALILIIGHEIYKRSK